MNRRLRSHLASCETWHVSTVASLGRLQGQLIGVALSFLRNFGLFSGASGVLGVLSRGVAALGADQAAAEQRAQARHPDLVDPPRLAARSAYGTRVL